MAGLRRVWSPVRRLHTTLMSLACGGYGHCLQADNLGSQSKGVLNVVHTCHTPRQCTTMGTSVAAAKSFCCVDRLEMGAMLHSTRHCWWDKYRTTTSRRQGQRLRLGPRQR